MTRINCVIKNKLPNLNLQVVFQSKCKLINVFAFKGKVIVFLYFGIVDQFNCGSCNATYYAKTNLNFEIRICEHLGAFTKNGDNNLKKYHLFAIIHLALTIFPYTNNNEFKTTLLESLLINSDHPSLDKAGICYYLNFLMTKENIWEYLLFIFP